MKIGDIVRASDDLFSLGKNVRTGVVTELAQDKCFVAFENTGMTNRRGEPPFYGWWYFKSDVEDLGCNILEKE